MDMNKLVARMNAEGITASIQSIAAAIVKAGDSLRAHGLTAMGEEVKQSALEEELNASEAYHDGYMYRHWYSKLNGVDIEARYNHSVSKHDEDGSSAYLSYSKMLLDNAAIGAILTIETGDENRTRDQYRKTGAGYWCWETSYSEQEEKWENAAVFLPAGIRQATADILGCHVSNVFHQAFDLAVERLYQ